MYTNNRDAYRQTYILTWQKYQKKLPLDAVESQLIEVILLHPEYHAFLEKPNEYQTTEFTLEENPFFHMSLHVAIREQIRMNRPFGVAMIHQQLMENQVDRENAEHRMMACLAEMIWLAQQTGTMPNEEEYLKKLRELSQD